VTIRPILPEDEPLLVKFHATLSDRTVYMRYLQPMLLQERVVHDRLSRICHGDYDREITLVAETRVGDDSNLLGVVRLSKLYGTTEARLSILVGDSFQGNGLGSELVRRAIEVARNERITGLSTTLTSDNQVMLHIFHKLGFDVQPDREGKFVSATIDL
jgi:acetyltransferase